MLIARWLRSAAGNQADGHCHRKTKQPVDDLAHGCRGVFRLLWRIAALETRVKRRIVLNVMEKT